MPGLVGVAVNDQEVRLGLGDLRASVADRSSMLNIAGVLMRASVARTFREEGSPAGSWPALAISTLKNKKYRGGHKLLILSGRLFSSITYVVEGDTLTIGTNVVYARVQQEGSADRRGAGIGPQAKLPDRRVLTSTYDYARSSFRRKGIDLRADKNGKLRRVRVRYQGPANRTMVHVREGSRHQNIRPRPFLVIRPEDPQRIVIGIEAYLGGKVGGA
jgi:phage gpG-like protein